MEAFNIENFSFTYPKRETPAIRDVDFTLKNGEFVVVCGKSGGGKTTLIRSLKPSLAPKGRLCGKILFKGKPLHELSEAEEAAKIGYILQSPDEQIVTDKVWHELAFGVENLGWKREKIRTRVAETAAYFGLEDMFEKDTSQLSGGQKQILNLAAVMIMEPEVLILDEPTSQLDPVAAEEFLEYLYRINRDLGVTVLLTEHRLDKVIPMADRLVVLEEGRVFAEGEPSEVGGLLAENNHPMLKGMPIPFQTYALARKRGFTMEETAPLDVRQGRLWLDRVLKNEKISQRSLLEKPAHSGDDVVKIKEIWFKYNKYEEDVLKNLNLNIKRGEMLAILGGNGSGKSTLLSLISGIRKPYRGRIKICDKNGLRIGAVPQNPQTVFASESVEDDLLEMLTVGSTDEKRRRIEEVAETVGIKNLLSSHPYDLSGGEQQRAALAKILLMNPDILLLDEPTKGIDAFFKKELASILLKLKEEGNTIVIVSHDVEFCAENVDRCLLLFNGEITSEGLPREFFSGNSHYTTSGNMLSRHRFENAITAEDVENLIEKNLCNRAGGDGQRGKVAEEGNAEDRECDGRGSKYSEDKKQGSSSKKVEGDKKRQRADKSSNLMKIKHNMLFPGMLLLALVMMLRLTTQLAENREYMLMAVIIAFAVMIPFFWRFERRRPEAAEVVLISVMITLAVVSRVVFVIPNIKPTFAIIIIAGAYLGADRGFITGAMTAFVSNFMLGQGPWTVFQMVAWGTMGMVAGVMGGYLLAGHRKFKICVYGAVSAFLFHGIITDIWSVLAISDEVTWASIIAVYSAGLSFNFMLAVSSVIFLWILTEPMLRKLDRINLKWNIS